MTKSYENNNYTIMVKNGEDITGFTFKGFAEFSRGYICLAKLNANIVMMLDRTARKDVTDFQYMTLVSITKENGLTIKMDMNLINEFYGVEPATESKEVTAKEVTAKEVAKPATTVKEKAKPATESKEVTAKEVPATATKEVPATMTKELKGRNQQNRHYTVTLPNGAIATRTSATRDYSHAIIAQDGTGSWGVYSYSSRLDLARKTVSSLSKTHKYLSNVRIVAL